MRKTADTNPPGVKEFKTAVDKGRYEFLQAELAITGTFVDLGGTEIDCGDREAAVRLAEKAEIGCRTLERFLPDLQDDGQRADFEEKLGELRVRVAGLRARLQKSPL